MRRASGLPASRRLCQSKGEFISTSRDFKTILVTGGAGFIGSNFIRFLLGRADFRGRIINLDALTYAGNLESLADVSAAFGGSRYFFERADIRDLAALGAVFERYEPDAVVHFAAESHVDRSILGPEAFVTTNVIGTYNLLETSRAAWKGRSGTLFHHISTDEVYGSLGDSGSFKETTPYDPRSPYSASKASSDHLVMAYHHTYGLPVTMSNCSNNYGPYQFPEKLIPLMILNMRESKPLPVYGDGKNVRDWIYVEDHNAAVWEIVRRGELGRSYNIGGENEWENIRLLGRLIEIVAEETGKDADSLRGLVTYVKDRPGHDRRYAIDCSRIKDELGWKRASSFDEGLRKTVRWYLENASWCAHVRSGEYKDWIDDNYARR
jgi:dTDP-glucose 4,6-dehydratase